MSKKEYIECILNMLNSINNLTTLQSIYKIVQNYFRKD